MAARNCAQVGQQYGTGRLCRRGGRRRGDQGDCLWQCAADADAGQRLGGAQEAFDNAMAAEIVFDGSEKRI
ncbi:MAG: hypothetical protein KDB14_20735 [Planctomycetales bacterium]|nr:hypothetical protein [Planctomycetales bacterium]